MRPATVWQFKFNLAGDEFPLPPLAPGWRFLQGLIEATSNFGQAAVLDWEWANPMVAATAIPNRFSLMNSPMASCPSQPRSLIRRAYYVVLRTCKYPLSRSTGCPFGYSSRRAIIGSTRAARRAGRYAATVETPSSTATATANVIGSCGGSP